MLFNCGVMKNDSFKTQPHFMRSRSIICSGRNLSDLYGYVFDGNVELHR